MSIEALAMAGVDYMQCSIDLEAMENFGPSYLLLGDGGGDLFDAAPSRPVREEIDSAAAVSVVLSEGQWRIELEKKAKEKPQHQAAISVAQTAGGATNQMTRWRWKYIRCWLCGLWTLNQEKFIDFES